MEELQSRIVCGRLVTTAMQTLTESEEANREEYQLEKKRLKGVYSKRGFQRIIARVTKQMQREWRVGLLYGISILL